MRIIILVSMIVSLLFPSLCLARDVSIKDAYSLYYKGKKQGAIKMMEEYVEMNPDPGAFYFLGYAYYELKQMDRASKYFNDAYSRMPFYSPMSEDEKGTEEIDPQLK